ncbi:oligosaccharide flippase family protein [bacterium]|nr:oligosaccharide flippase family protein [bacterium]
MSTSKLIRGITHILLAEALLIPTGFVTAVFLARELEPTGYGTFALISQFVIWLEFLLVSGLESTTIKFISGSDNKTPLINTVYSIYFAAGIMVALLVIVLAPGIALLVKTPEIAPLLKLLSIDIPLFTLAHAGRHIVAGCQKFHQNAVMRSIYWITRLIFIIFFVSIGMSVKGAIIGLICASLAESAIGFFYVRPNFLHGGFAKLKQFWHFLAPLQLAEINKRLLVQELIVLKAMGGTSVSTGLYGVAKNLALAPVLLSRAVKPTLLSILNHKRQENDLAARETALTCMRAVFWFIPLAVLLAASSREIILLIFGAAYRSAAPLFSILLFAGMGFFAINIGMVIFTAWNRPRLSISVTWPMVPAAITGYILLYPKLGAMGIAIATLSAVLISTILTFHVLYREWQLSLPLSTIIRGLSCSLIMFTAAHFWQASGVIVLVKLTILSLLNGLLLWRLGEFSLKERMLFTGLVFSKQEVFVTKQNEEDIP